MKTIWKFPLDVKSPQRIYMPLDSKILYVREQDEQICVWAEVETTKATQERVIEVFGTGHEIHNDIGTERDYLGSAHLSDGRLIFHVYERIN